jgi:tetratricopeptide (TPR) repeat protein
MEDAPAPDAFDRRPVHRRTKSPHGVDRLSWKEGNSMTGPTSLALNALAAAALLSAPTGGDDTWVRVRSAHFEVLSDAGDAPAPAREAARRLEGLRVVLQRLFPSAIEVQRPITLLVLESQARFASLAPGPGDGGRDLNGFFQSGGERDYAVLHLSPLHRRPFEGAEHEYAHLVLNGALPAQPPWVAEGLADVLSGGLLDGGEAQLGASRPEYQALLRKPSSLPLERVLAVGYDSPEYSGHPETGMLYARSWALARWALHRQGFTGLRSFLQALASGEDPQTAFTDHLGSLAEAEATLLDVPPGPLLRLTVTDETIPSLEVEAPAPTADVEQRLGDLLLHAGRTTEARRHLDRALAADPGHVPTRNSLADLLVRRGEWDAARRHLDAVLRSRPGDPTALLRRANLRIGRARMEGVALEPEAESRIVADLEIALSRAPQLYDAALLLAQLRPEPVAERIALLEPLVRQQPARTDVAQALSQLHFKRGDLDAARRVLARALDATRDPTARYLVARQLARLEGFGIVTAEVRGDLIFLACRPDGTLRFTISADPRTVRVEAESSRSFLVHGEESGEVELLCGEQDRPVVVRYQPGTSDGPDTDGTLLWLAFDDDS